MCWTARPSPRPTRAVECAERRRSRAWCSNRPCQRPSRTTDQRGSSAGHSPERLPSHLAAALGARGRGFESRHPDR